MDTSAEDLAYQEAALQGVSRTFALTIPQLPESLRAVVGNAYLLCRIADTIEDSDALELAQKKRFYDEFVAVVAGEAEPEAFAEGLAPGLTGSTLEAERDLIRNTPTAVRLTHGFDERDQAVLLRCVRIMSEGMEQFQEENVRDGLRDMAHLDAYCYHVAGVVGEMLTDLFCTHSEPTAARGDKLRKLAVSFGQGLQMVNILKDIWDDKQRDVCWLPRDVFARHGFDLDDLSPSNHGAPFQQGLIELVAVAHRHLRNALTYTLTLPKSEKGIRAFCLWALGMAVLTLRNVYRRPDFTSGDDVKISRRSVRTVIFISKAFGGSNWMLSAFFTFAARGLPLAG